MTTVQELHALWLACPTMAERNHLLAQALGQKEWSGLDFCNDLRLAQKAMDQAWGLMEEAAPSRISCTVSRGVRQGGSQCSVEWWLDDGHHEVLPQFPSEAESRAFAAYVFLSLMARPI